MTKRFPLRVVLTVTTGRLLTQSKSKTDNGISDLYELLGWMTDDQPFTHQLPRFGMECKPWLLRWFPELKTCGDKKSLRSLDLLIESLGAESGCEYWLDKLMDGGKIKREYDVPKIPKDDHDRKNPVSELVEMVGDQTKVIVVETP